MVMDREKHTVLGAGVVGAETVRALRREGRDVVSVSRKPAGVDDTPHVTADLLVPGDVERAVRGSTAVYLTAGLPYVGEIWAAQWPVIVENVVAATAARGAHLVYLDNVYAYGLVEGEMTEDTVIHPRSKKGTVRAETLAILASARDNGASISIGRSADFYGPNARTSVFNTFALDRIARGRDATWLFDADQPHSLTYTPDIGAALAVLGTSPHARGGTWHLPTAPALTGREYIRLAAGSDARVKVMGSASMRLGALFNRAARETLEMAYQYSAPYLFDSCAFTREFGLEPTPIADGIAASLRAARGEGQPARR